MKKLGIQLLILLGFFSEVVAQEDSYDSLLNYYLATDSVLLDELELYLASDSMDIFDIIDSLLETDISYSQLSIRMGYTSDISYAGRTFGFNQFGLTGGVSYYHKTGLFGDVSGYWNSNLDPSYNPTIVTAGYMGNITSKWTYTASYDHFFYNQSNSNNDSSAYYPLSSSLNLSSFYELGNFTAAGDYSFLFGNEEAHRLRFSAMYSFVKRDWGFLDRFVFMPSFSVLLGNATIFEINPIVPEMNLNTRLQLRNIMSREYGQTLMNYLWRNNRERYLAMEKATYESFKEELTTYEISSNNAFGIMNYSISAPLYMYINNFTIALSYHYNIPVALPGEDLSLNNNSYVGASLIYNIPFLKKNR